MCIGCDEPLTTEHILLTCSDFIEIRESPFAAVLFQDISPETICVCQCVCVCVCV